MISRSPCTTPYGRCAGLRIPVSSLALTLAVSLACVEGPQPPPPPVDGIDLTRQLLSAEVWAPIGEIGFGLPDARRFMLRGWSLDEKWGRTNFVWSVGGMSTLRVHSALVRDVELELSCWAFLADSLPQQVITVVCNGKEVGEVQLGKNVGPGARYRLTIPASAVVEGSNTIGFRYAFTSRPADHIPGNSDSRLMAVAWNRIRFLAVQDRPEPAVATHGRQREIILPFSTGVDFYMLLQPGSMLEMDELQAWKRAGSDSLLEVTIQTRDDPPAVQQLPLSGASPGDLVLDLHIDTPKIVRLGLRARPSRGSGGLRLVNPVVRDNAFTCPTASPRPVLEKGDATGSRRRPNVIIYLIDALRADHVGCYGYPRPTTPNIDAFAAEATRFSFAMAQSSWTKPAVASVFTGLRPDQHDTNTTEAMLPAQVETLAERLSTAGYQTAGITTNGVVSAKFGFDQGFDHHQNMGVRLKTPEIHQLSDSLNREALTWLGERDLARPFFLYLHATDPHAPYYPPEPFRSRFAAEVPPEVGHHNRAVALATGRAPVTEGLPEQMLALYDAEIAFNDHSFGELMEALAENELVDETLIIVLADHGEEFYDHGRWSHGFTLFSEQLHIPLIIRFPEGLWSGKTVDQVAQQIDIVPTVLEFIGMNRPPEIEGRSLLRYLQASPDEGATSGVFSFLGKATSRQVEAVVFGRMKLIHYKTYDQPRPEIELYDLDFDPAEEHDLAADNPILVGYLRSLLRASHLEQGLQSTSAVLDDETVAQLEALGYLDR